MTLENAKAELEKFVKLKTSMRPAFVQPLLDAVEVVRCKDCRYYDAENHNCLDEMAYARIWNEDDYCSFAERREDGKTD